MIKFRSGYLFAILLSVLTPQLCFSGSPKEIHTLNRIQFMVTNAAPAALKPWMKKNKINRQTFPNLLFTAAEESSSLEVWRLF